MRIIKSFFALIAPAAISLALSLGNATLFAKSSYAATSVNGTDGAVQFGQDIICIETSQKTLQLNAEIAASAEQRAQGLMERTTLAPDAGMLFLYPKAQPASHGFWMYRTRIPLDLAFLNAEGHILSIRTMEPCTAGFSIGCKVYRSGEPFHGALEVNRGYFAAHGVAPGDRVIQSQEVKCDANSKEPATQQPLE